MRHSLLAGAIVPALMSAVPAAAQERAPFTGPLVGVEGGMAEQHFYIERSINDRVIDARYYRDYGPAVGVYAGYDLPLGGAIRVGAEIEAVSGWSENVARIGEGEFGYAPRFGYRGTVRAGVVLRKDALAYASFGYGGNRYRTINTAGVDGEITQGWGSSFIVGGGIEFRATDRLGVRFDIKHLDNHSNQMFVGIPIRF